MPGLFLALGFLFASLGVWQIERRAQKLVLIAAVDRRARALPVQAPGPDRWAGITFKTNAYQPVSVHGRFLHERETFVQAVTDFGPGFWVMTPLRTHAGWTVLVNRGFIDAEPSSRQKLSRPSGPVSVTGRLRTSEPGGGFLHSNDPEHHRWYSRDVAAIARARNLGQIAPYFIDAGPNPKSAGQPIGGLTVISFSNNHLQYALTWFALAILSGMGAVRAGWRGRPR